MRVDYDKRTLSCSVSDLIYESTYRRIGVERGDGFRRMWLGQEIHSRRAEERSGSDANYRPEVCVSHALAHLGWSIEVSGRIDGVAIDRASRSITIEEVKSLHFDLELEALHRSEKLQRHLFQLMIYAWFLLQDEAYDDYSVHPQLILIDLVSGATETVDAPFVFDDVESAFLAVIDRMIGQLESQRALRLAKCAYADSLPFPYDRMRPYQAEMIEAVERAVRERETLLVSAPTGVGKTIAAIYPALRESLRAGKKLFFLTSKTLQQEIAVSTLQSLNDGSFRVLRLRAKQKMCANTEVICHEDFCPYAAKYSEKMARNNLRSRIVTNHSYFDPDVTFELATSEEVCPFEVSLELIDEADVIVCDYNYVFDPYVGLRNDQQSARDFSDAVLIIDEAHNLVDRGRGYYSPDLHEAQFTRIATHLASRPGCNLEGWEDLLDELRDHFVTLSEAIEKNPRSEGGSSQALCEIDRRIFLRQRVGWERLIVRYVTWKIERQIAEEDDPLIDFYFKLVKFSNLLTNDGDEFAHIIERTPEGLRLKIFCKDASSFLGEIIDSAHSVVAISATLQPFDFYRQMLGFPSDRVAEVALPSPFPRANRKIFIVSDVDTTYKERALHYDRIASTVAEMSEAAGGNFLALFPSYAFLDQVTTRLPVLKKNLMVQRSEMTDWERRRFLETLKDSRSDGNLILAVTGGMYAEGVDYQGEMLSGVFVVGPALPAVSLEQELLKEYFDDRYGAGFEYAYLIPGMTRVVQSAGRVIRSERDIGVIGLLCKRFTREMYSRYFPADWFEESPRELVVKKPADEIRNFFEAKRTPQLRLL